MMADDIVVGMWFTEKKKKKINLELLKKLCREGGVILKELDITRALDEQQPFRVFFHRLWILLADVEAQKPQAVSTLSKIEGFLREHPEIIVVEPLNCVRQLLHRSNYYSLLQTSPLFRQGNVFVPKFTLLKSGESVDKLYESGVKFPCVCKPAISPGCHEMSVVFNVNGLMEVSRPCVVQSFINHDAVLYKLFVCGDRQFIATRPSVKNFSSSDETPSRISFHSHDVSKSSSCSPLIEVNDTIPPCKQTIYSIGEEVRRVLGLNMLGIDIVQEVKTRRLAVIDVNFFPSYEGMSDFIPCLADLIVNIARTSNS